MADPAIIRRLRIVMGQLTQYASSGKDDKFSRFAWVMQAMFEEVLDELIERQTNEETLAQWFVIFGQIIEWCGSGDDSVLPDHVREYLVRNHPGEMLALEAPKTDASVNA